MTKFEKLYSIIESSREVGVKLSKAKMFLSKCEQDDL